MALEPLSGHVFVFTGDMSIERDEAKRKALLLGARVTSAVSSKTTHLVAGTDPGPSKVEKARELGIKILGEKEFVEIMEEYRARMAKDVSTSLPGKEALSPRTNSGISCRNGTLPWAEKYRPQTIGDLVGNRSVYEQLNGFVQGKYRFKAALVSGSPGVGKTTAALVVCKMNGVTPIEFNASDLRSKKSIAEHISGLVNNFAISRDMKNGKKVLIMDEVDGMTSDRGGIPELVDIIKRSRVPIICICNDKTHIKMRTLASHCLDLHFRKLDARSVLPRIKYILQKEGKHLGDGVLNEIIASSNGDLRYVLNTVQSIVGRDAVSLESICASLVRKNPLKGTFEVAAELFQKRSIADKTDLYFEDHSLMPLFVHENYLKCTFKGPRDLLVSAESISFSDLLDTRIHGPEQEWFLMPYHAFFSTVCPLNNKTLQKRIDFPSFLGQNSKRTKNSRLLGAVTTHLRAKMTRRDFRMFAADILYTRFARLLEGGDVDGSIAMLCSTELLKDDMTSMGEILGVDMLRAISPKTKSALTREYKKLDRRLPYSVSSHAVGENDGDDF